MHASARRRRLAAPLALVFVLVSHSAAHAAKYNNTVFGYTVDYPSWWTIDAKTLSDGVRFRMPGSDAIWMQIRVSENPEGQSLADLLVILLKTLSGAPPGLVTEPGLPTPATPAVPTATATTAAAGAAPETTPPGVAAGAGRKTGAAAGESKPIPSIAVGTPPGPPSPPAAGTPVAAVAPEAPPVDIDPSKPIPGVTVRWITLDGAEAWYAESEGQWIVKCLKDGFVYELSANSRFGTMYQWYFGSFFNSFRFQPRLGR